MQQPAQMIAPPNNNLNLARDGQSGTRAPEDAAGQAGDLYINKITTELFQKGTDGKWNFLFKMKGERGGGEVTPGLTYASGVPTGDATPIGGSYIDTATGDYFKRLPDGTY